MFRSEKGFVFLPPFFGGKGTNVIYKTNCLFIGTTIEGEETLCASKKYFQNLAHLEFK